LKGQPAFGGFGEVMREEINWNHSNSPRRIRDSEYQNLAADF
jgi:hypothetical protein